MTSKYDDLILSTSNMADSVPTILLTTKFFYPASATTGIYEMKTKIVMSMYRPTAVKRVKGYARTTLINDVQYVKMQ
jgi:hypothetical protein